MQQSVTLGARVPIIHLSFHGKILPDFTWDNAKWVEDKVSDGPVVTRDGQSAGSGVLFINEPRRNTSIDGLIEDLVDAGYYPVAIVKRRSHKAQTDATHKVIQVTFARNQAEDEGLRVLFAQMFDELKEWARTSLYGVIAHKNPRYFDGKVVEGLATVAIDVNGREPLVHENGTPVMRWHKDAAGNKLHQYQLRPAQYVGVDEGEICILVDEDLSPTVGALVGEHEHIQTGDVLL
jgi:hypothetical protein